MCAALYCPPTGRDFGVLTSGARGFGGLLPDLDESKGDNVAFLPQYNLDAFWRRQATPAPIGLCLPLIEPRSRKLKLTRLPGDFDRNTPARELDNRNLLAATLMRNDDVERGNEDVVRIWTASERSDRKLLERFDVKVNEAGDLVAESCTAWSDGSSNGLKMKEPMLELRKAEFSDDNDSLWIRDEKMLSLMREEMDTAHVEHIFLSSVRDFKESRLMLGEIGVVDRSGKVWHGNVEHKNLSHVKGIDTETQNCLIDFSDHPRVVYVASKYEMKTFDLRDRTGGGTMIYQVPEFDCRREKDSFYVTEMPKSKAKLRHLQAIPDQPHHVILVSTHQVHLIDDRFANNPLISLGHSIPQGSHHIVVSDSTEDASKGGEIVSIYALDHLLTGITTTKFYRHKSDIWSSCHALRKTSRPEDYNKIVRRPRANDVKIRSEPDRSMCLVQEIQDEKSRFVDILLRQTDDGAIWWQKMVYGDVEAKERRRFAERSIREIDKYSQRIGPEPKYVETLPEELRKIDTQVFRIDGPINEKLWKKAGEKAKQEMTRCREGMIFEKDPGRRIVEFAPVPPDAMLSKVVDDVWNRYIGPSVQRVEDSQFDETEEATSSRGDQARSRFGLGD